MATGAILAVAVAVLTSATLTPAALAMFGRAAAKRSALLHWSRRPEAAASPFWNRWVSSVMRRPWISALRPQSSCCSWRRRRVDGVGQQPAASVRLVARDPRRRGRGVPSARPGALGPVQVLVTFPDGGASSAGHSQTVNAIRQQMIKAPTSSR